MKLKKFLVWCLGLSIFFFVCGCTKIETEENEDYVGKYTVASIWRKAEDYPVYLTFRSQITRLRKLGFFDEHCLKEYNINNGYFVFVWRYRKETNISRLPIDKIVVFTSREKAYSLEPIIKFKFNINGILAKQKTEEDKLKHFINSECVISATITMTEKYMQENPILILK